MWQPHGTSSSPKHIVLGTIAYAKTLPGLQRAWELAKSLERRASSGTPASGDWTPEKAAEWWARRRGTPPYKGEPGETSVSLTWFDLFLGADLVFIGTSLDRAEIDLWWALHMRQRNLARVPAKQRPGTFVLSKKGSCPCHLKTEPAGVTPVGFEEWKGAWDRIFGG